MSDTASSTATAQPAVAPAKKHTASSSQGQPARKIRFNVGKSFVLDEITP